jgi:hypothetical protein
VSVTLGEECHDIGRRIPARRRGGILEQMRQRDLKRLGDRRAAARSPRSRSPSQRTFPNLKSIDATEANDLSIDTDGIAIHDLDLIAIGSPRGGSRRNASMQIAKPWPITEPRRPQWPCPITDALAPIDLSRLCTDAEPNVDCFTDRRHDVG